MINLYWNQRKLIDVLRINKRRFHLIISNNYIFHPNYQLIVRQRRTFFSDELFIFPETHACYELIKISLNFPNQLNYNFNEHIYVVDVAKLLFIIFSNTINFYLALNTYVWLMLLSFCVLFFEIQLISIGPKFKPWLTKDSMTSSAFIALQFLCTILLKINIFCLFYGLKK